MKPFLQKWSTTGGYLLLTVKHGEGVDEIVFGALLVCTRFSDNFDELLKLQCLLPIGEALDDSLLLFDLLCVGLAAARGGGVFNRCRRQR